MSTAAVTPDNGNPFNQPFDSEVQESAQRQAASQQASPNGNPFDEPLASEIADQKYKERAGADIQPVTTSTNPKLAAAMSAKDMPERVGATGALAAGAMLGGVLSGPAEAFAETSGGKALLELVKTYGKHAAAGAGMGLGYEALHKAAKLLGLAEEKKN